MHIVRTVVKNGIVHKYWNLAGSPPAQDGPAEIAERAAIRSAELAASLAERANRPALAQEPQKKMTRAEESNHIAYHGAAEMSAEELEQFYRQRRQELKST